VLTAEKNDQYFENMIENAQELYLSGAAAFSNWMEASQKEIGENHAFTAALSSDLVKNLSSMLLQTKPIPALDTFMGADQNLSAFSKASIEFFSAAAELQALIIAKFVESSENYLARGEPESGSDDKTIRAWLSSTNSDVLEFQQSKAYLDAQKKYVTSLTQFQKSYRALVEDLQILNHLPTQSEIDDISKGLHDLKREVRTLKLHLSKDMESKK
jgi:hypothetical protein